MRTPENRAWPGDGQAHGRLCQLRQADALAAQPRLPISLPSVRSTSRAMDGWGL